MSATPMVSSFSQSGSTTSSVSYLSLSPIQKRLSGEITRVFSQQNSQDLPPETKRKLITTLIDDLDLQNPNAPSSSWRSQSSLDTVFEVLKVLGRSAIGTEPLAREKSLRVLLEHSYVLPPPSGSLPAVLPPHSKDALRTVCNTLFLHSSARMNMASFPTIISSVSRLLNATEKDEDAAFLLLRLLLFITTDNDTFVRQAVERESIASYISDLAESYAASPAKEKEPCLIEALKLSYRLTSFYARLAPGSGRISPSSSGSSDRDSLESGRRTPSKKEKEKKSKRFWKRRSSARKEKGADEKAAKETEDLEGEWIAYFERLVNPLVHIIEVSETTVPLPPITRHSVNALMFFPANSLPTSPSPFLTSYVTLLDVTAADVLKDEDPLDGVQIVTGQAVEESLVAFIWTLRKIARENESSRAWLKKLLLPDEIDRSLPLDQTPTFIGRLLVIMKSSTCPGCALGVGELLLTLCDRSPLLLSEQIGYGIASGFLANIQALCPPPDNWLTIHGKEVDSTTGSYVDSQVERRKAEGKPGLEDMTEEEKERELEKLMDSIDRLNKVGVMKAELPGMTKEMNEKVEEKERKQEADRRKEEEEEEEEALRELKAYKERRSR
ncbi:hypothetical protein BT69DRAFT_1333781 [Atractiella rhizophila]|nr:hypothetical protein BT69DRAFT_1333781 [Atractiella rhizophila]